MSQDNLFMQTDGLRSFAQTHADVVAGLSGLIGSAAEAAGVETTHGTIASSVHSALSGALEARHGTQRAVSDIGTKLEESLRKAAHAYEQVDQRSAANVRSVGDGVDKASRPGGPAGSGAGAPRPQQPTSSGGTAGAAAGAGGGGSAASSPMGGTGVGGGASGASQVLGQVGQMGGQLAQSASGLFQGKGGSQSLSQLPRQVMQGVQQAVQQVSQLGQQHGDETGLAQAEEPSESRDEAAPGETGASGRAPVEVNLVRDAPRQAPLGD